MPENEFQRFIAGLQAKRDHVSAFLETATASEIELCCQDERNALAHLEVIENALNKAEEQTLGICEVCQGFVEPSWLEMDYTACVCLDHMSESERRSLETELELSQVVQRALLPQAIPSIPGAELAAFSRPAEIVGGDYFDFFHFRDGGHGLVIADISGHGVSAGMLMSSLQASIRTMAPQSDSPAEVLERINRFYIHNVHFTTFVTVFLAHFDSHNNSLAYTNAGHNPPAILRKGEPGLVWLRPTAPAIGLSEEFRPRTQQVSLQKGDILLLYTDGITEAENPAEEQFGSGRLSELLVQCADLHAEEIIRNIRQGLEVFTEGRPLQDDTTFIALKILE